MSEQEFPATVDSSLRLGSGFNADDRDHIVATFARLTTRLGSYPDGSVDLDLSVKERGTSSQRTVLEALIAGNPRLVATSDETDIDKAFIEVRDDLIRQLTDAKNRTEPSNRRSLRDTIRGE